MSLKARKVLQMNITLEKITHTIKKNLIILLAAAVLLFGCAFAYMKLFVAPNYYTSAKFYIKDTAAMTGTSPSDVNRTRLLAETFIQIFDSENFFEIVHSNLPADLAEKYTPGALRSGASFGIKNETEVIEVTFTSLTKEDVKPVVNAILASVPTHLEIAYGECSCHIVDDPSGTHVSSSRTMIVCTAVTVVGVVLLFFFFLVRDALDVHIRSAADIAERYGIPILGTIPEFDTTKLKKKEGAGDGKVNK